VATRIQISATEYLLKIFNNDCSLREIVNFPTLETGKEHYQYKINAAYCERHNRRAPKTMDADLQDEMKIYLPDDESDLANLQSRLNRDCKQWSAQNSSKASTPAATK